MADNTLLNPGVGGDLIATDDIVALGAKVQWMKLAFGADGAFVPVADADASGLPVQVAPGEVQTQLFDSGGVTMTIPTNGAPSIVFQFAVGGTVSATIVTEGSTDGGTTWGTILNINGSAAGTGSGTQLATNVNPSYVNCAGLTHVRARTTAYTSGASTLIARTSNAPVLTHSINGSLANILTIFPGTSFTALGKAEDGPHNTADVGVFALAVRNDNDANFTNADQDYSPINVDASGRLRAMLRPTGSAAGNTHSLISANTTNSTNVKSAAGNLYTIVAVNSNAAVRYLKLYAKATAPTIGTDTPLWRLPIPPNNVPLVLHMPVPLPFLNGIGYGLTTGNADSDTGAVAAGEILVNLMYN